MSPDDRNPEEITLRRYIEPVRRFLVFIVAGTVIGALLGLVASSAVSTRYTSQVRMLVSPISSDPLEVVGTSSAAVDMDTEAEVATSRVVADLANQILGDQPPAKEAQALLDQVEASVRGTRVMEISFEASTPEIAQRGALAFSQAYLTYRDDLATDQLALASVRIETRIAELQTELTDVTIAKSEIPEGQRNTAAWASLDISETTLLDELSVNQRKLADLRAVITNDATIIGPATLPSSPSSLGRLTLIVGGAAVGFTLAIAVAFAFDAARRGRAAAMSEPEEASPAPDGPASAAQVVSEIQIPTEPWNSDPAETPAGSLPGSLAAMPPAPEPAREVRAEALVHPRAAESVRQLRDHLLHAIDVDHRALVVVDGGDQAALPVSAAIAMELASQGRHTLLIDADGTSPGLHVALRVDEPAGLTTALANDGATDGLLWSVDGHPNLEILFSGDSTAQALSDPAKAAALDRIVGAHEAVVLLGGEAIDSPLVRGDGTWVGAITLATSGAADPRSVSASAFTTVQASRHPLVGIVSIMTKPALSPNPN